MSTQGLLSLHSWEDLVSGLVGWERVVARALLPAQRVRRRAGPEDSGRAQSHTLEVITWAQIPFGLSLSH